MSDNLEINAVFSATDQMTWNKYWRTGMASKLVEVLTFFTMKYTNNAK